MREIKFRAWDKEEKKMCYTELDEFSQLFVWFDGAVGQIDTGCPDGGIGSADVELMQYTGLKDKNEKEVYEGDIVRDERNEILEVKWQLFECAFFYSQGVHHMGQLHLTHEVEVIGNVYENPDLLNNL